MSATLVVQRALAHRPPARRGQPSGLLVGLALFVGTVAGSLILIRGGFALTKPGDVRLDVFGTAAAVLVSAPLIGWRRHPTGVLVATAAASVAMAAARYPLGFPLAPAVALYLLVSGTGRANTGRTNSEKMGTIAISAAFLVAYVAAVAASESVLPVSEAFHTTLFCAVAWFAAERTRLRREQIEELTRDAARERKLAAAEERARIARDLHDSVGHAINVIGVRAGAARLRHDDEPGRTKAALHAIEELARTTVAEIDQLVGALRDRSADARDGQVDAPLGLNTIETLLAEHGSTGLTVTTTVEGTPRSLAAAVDQAAYRIIQEALTNASRHGSGATGLEITYGALALTIVVTNPFIAPHTAPSRIGHGLIGMAERAGLLGGTLEIERPPRRYILRATLPYAIGAA
jgi:signal transduction histidine kinase